MSLIFADNCASFYSTAAQATAVLYTTLTATLATSGLPAGNVGSSAFKNLSNVTIPFPTTAGPYFVGVRYNPNAVITAGQNFAIWLDASSGQQLTLTTNLDGTLTARRGGGNGTILGTSSAGTPALVDGVWQYLEFGVKISSTVGTVDIRVNGISVLSLTGQNTQGTANTTIAAFQMLGGGIANFCQDIYICDSNGSHNNTFLGDVHVSQYLATSNGTYTQYTPNGAGSLYQCVNAATPTDSTVFASDNVVSDKMSVNLDDSSVTGTIAGVILVGRSEKTDAGTRTANLFALNNGHEVDGSSIALATSYKYNTQILEVDPNTGIPFTNAGFNTLEAGITTAS